MTLDELNEEVGELKDLLSWQNEKISTLEDRIENLEREGMANANPDDRWYR